MFEVISNRTLLILAGIIAIATVLVEVIDQSTQKDIDKAAIQMGLQQCEINHEIMWRKECPK